MKTLYSPVPYTPSQHKPQSYWTLQKKEQKKCWKKKSENYQFSFVLQAYTVTCYTARLLDPCIGGAGGALLLPNGSKFSKTVGAENLHKL